jgi:hypothetical protein
MILYGVKFLRLPEYTEWFGFNAYVIDDIRSHQLEGVRYRLAECEEGRRFLCLCYEVEFTKLFLHVPFGNYQVVWTSEG